MHTFAWCEQGFHADYKGEWSAPCKGRYRKVIKEKKKVRRKVIETVVVDEEVVCECPCHDPETVVDSPRKTRKPRRKK